jgi:hypothetical protein
MNRREFQRSMSNNSSNTNKNICGLRVAEHLQVADSVPYLHTIEDLVRAGRTKYTVRSRYSKVSKLSVGGARAKLVEIGKEVNAIGFIVNVRGHVLFLNSEGRTVVDTAPRKRDARKMYSCYVVYAKD